MNLLRFLIILFGAFNLKAEASAQEVPLDFGKPYCASQTVPVCKPNDDGGNFLPKLFKEAWPTRTIPFAISNSVSNNEKLKDAVIESFSTVKKYTGLNFFLCDRKQIESLEKPIEYIFVDDKNIKGEQDCSVQNIGWKKTNAKIPFRNISRGLLMTVGKNTWKGGAAPINRAACDENFKGGIIHEILHSVGLYHADVHPDRDIRRKGKEILLSSGPSFPREYVGITPNSSAFLQFRLKKYDYYSILHHDCRPFIPGKGFAKFAEKTKREIGSKPYFNPLDAIGKPACIYSENGKINSISDVGLLQCLSKIDAEAIGDMYNNFALPTQCDSFSLHKLSSNICKQID